jgi:hypothetical protein
MMRSGPEFKAASSPERYLGDSLENGGLEPDLSGDVEGKSLPASQSAVLETYETIWSG